MSSLTPAGLHHLVATFRRIDDLLVQAEADLAPAEAARLFPACTADAAPIQRKLIGDETQRVRAEMRAALERFGATPPPPRTSAVWTAKTRLMAARIAASELAPEHMRSHGALTADTGRDVRVMADGLAGRLDRMESYLAQGPDQMLQSRLQRIATTGMDGRLLSELDRIVATYDLVEFHSALEQLAHRLACGELEVAVFGRVNSGKSSLLNHLLRTAVLPVGVTPMTAIPVRIVYDKAPGGRVSFANAAPEIVDLDRLAEFASEQQNPGNSRHASSLTVQLPAPLLQTGIVFVDTPAVEPAQAGLTAETRADLLQCDVGVVLVDASSTLTGTELELLETLRHGGAEVLVLLSKADVLDGQELQRAVSHVEQELAARLQTELPVHAVSVKGPAAAWCDHWLETVLEPRLRDHRTLSRRVLERKLGLLRDAVRSALEKRLLALAGETDAVRHERLRKIDRMLGQALALLDPVEQTPPQEIEWLAKAAASSLDEAAHNAAVIWNERHDPSCDVTGLIEASVQSRAGMAATAVGRQLAELRAVLRASLAEARGEALASAGLNWAPGDDLPRPDGMPLLDGASVVPRTVLHRPALAFAGVSVLKHGILEQIKASGMEQRITGAFASYGHRLDAWRRSTIHVLHSGFIAQCERAPKPPPGSDQALNGLPDAAQAILADLRRLDEHGHQST